MRMKLFAVEIVRPNGSLDAQIVAPSEEAASHFAQEYHQELGMSVAQITVARIDNRLPSNRLEGLDDMLETAPVGFASFCPPCGWFVHTVVPATLKLFRIDSEDGGVLHVVAPNADIAATIWLSTIDLDEDGCHPLWSITNGLDHLDDRQRQEMQRRLKFGPVGAVAWDDERGWLVK